jgi:hypothetical protein
MRKAWAVALTAVVAGATIGVAAPARAADEDCLDYFNQSQQLDFQTIAVDVQNLKVTIDPAGVRPDVAMLQDELTEILGIFLCLEGGTVTGLAGCLADKAAEIVGSLDPVNLNLRYVYRDPTTGQVTLDGGLLLADLTHCIPPIM